jgi:hypothetical protein
MQPFKLLAPLRRLFSHRARARLALSEDDPFFSPPPAARDLIAPSREELLAQSFEAWRTNPLARRITGLTSQYVVGGGIRFSCDDPAAARALEAFWHHRLNRMDARVVEWCDELTRSGNLFILLSTDAAGRSYVRAVPAAQIESITSAANDVEQELSFRPKPSLEDPEPAPWPAYDALHDGRAAGGAFPSVMLHYAINRPVGAQWGESDLGPLLKWLSRYANWLEDRARLNAYRNSFLYVVRTRFASEADRAARQAALSLNPPTPGSILVTDESESWEVLAPQLESAEANEDGLALKKMIAAGAGIPLHFLAEPESATRTTAEAAGGPTFRYFEQRQHLFLDMLHDLLAIVLRRAALVDARIPAGAPFELRGSDISARDNLSLAMSSSNIVSAWRQLYDLGLIDAAELVRMVYRFAGETVDPQELIGRAQRTPHPEPWTEGQTDGDGTKPAKSSGAARPKGAARPGKRRPEPRPGVDIENGEPRPAAELPFD